MHKWIVNLSLCIYKNDILKHIDKIKINSFLEMKSSKKEIDGILEKNKTA
ncbi:hypothetical protein AGMMS49573_07480 [Endomicrobiia bacterium]|nr:hypothetical protein [Candidatus Endomicrobium trichonymphae]GHT06452.1 hypothetical protein AGMMS49523_08180 [Endomicrobiia bacterium]GHT08917.1 hypothetical protein AGMMS49532_05340 [Endomicrobiia bacterium]GHT12597.1 hypothetical protein AGMMS49571_04850 [Endomicrobiia bacterium]GHT16826.1 hypothetical protein AGMMS49573_07480 [Endomicrobiia bacterium]GHT20684.1 hypothetical protein AGMMS49929_08010 [Endomicrobiia bacterium]